MLLGLFSVLLVGKRFFGNRISRWHHLKPFSGTATLGQAQKYLADADNRLGKRQYEGASQEFHSAAQIYLSLEDRTNAAKYYWSAAETLSKDSPKLGYGVALMYVLSAAAYMLYNSLEKANEAMTQASEINKKPGMDSESRISFMLEVLDTIRNKNIQQLLEDWPRLAGEI